MNSMHILIDISLVDQTCHLPGNRTIFVFMFSRASGNAKDLLQALFVTLKAPHDSNQIEKLQKQLLIILFVFKVRTSKFEKPQWKSRAEKHRGWLHHFLKFLHLDSIYWKREMELLVYFNSSEGIPSPIPTCSAYTSSLCSLYLPPQPIRLVLTPSTFFLDTTSLSPTHPSTAPPSWLISTPPNLFGLYLLNYPLRVLPNYTTSVACWDGCTFPGNGIALGPVCLAMHYDLICKETRQYLLSETFINQPESLWEAWERIKGCLSKTMRRLRNVRMQRTTIDMRMKTQVIHTFIITTACSLEFLIMQFIGLQFLAKPFRSNTSVD